MRYPLLLQNFGSLATSPGNIVTQNFQVRTNRGQLFALNLIVNEYEEPGAPFLPGSAYVVSVVVGGQRIINREPLGRHYSTNEFGREVDNYFHVNVSDSQTLVLEVDGRNPLATVNRNVSLLGLYTTPERDRFIRNFRYSRELNLKRESFSHNVLAGAAQRVVTEGLIPKNSGQVAGVTCFHAAVQSEIPLAFITLRVEGVTVFERVPSSYFSYFSKMEPYTFINEFQPGSTFEFITETDAATLNDAISTVSFIFNGKEQLTA